MDEEPSQFSDFDGRYEDPADDPLFEFNEDDPDRANIFARKELLKVGHVPKSGRIVGRDGEIKAVAAELRPIVRGGPPNNVIIYGKTGTGKSLVARHVTERARRAAESNGVSVGTVYVDCAQHNTQTRVAIVTGRTFYSEWFVVVSGSSRRDHRRGIARRSRQRRRKEADTTALSSYRVQERCDTDRVSRVVRCAAPNHLQLAQATRHRRVA